MRRRGIMVIVLLLAAVLIAPASPAAAGPYCGIHWGSLAKGNNKASMPGDVVNVRTGRHACYDRLVVDVDGPFAGYSVAYVSQVTGAGGTAVATRGGARLQVVARAGTQTDSSSAPYFLVATGGTVDNMRNVTGYRTFRQVAWAGSSGGVTTIALGVRARLPFRAFLLAGPGAGRSRLVVDVAHRW